MTITYSLDVASTRFCGFTKLLGRWKGSIYKILWKELLVFALGYALLSVIYRIFLNDYQKKTFEKVVIYCEAFIDLIPLSFVLGFYVSLVIGRWWNQFDCIPFPDKVCHKIAAFVHGSDERSRMIRRGLGRYLMLVQIFTFQSVSTAVKKRFPTTDHLLHAGLIMPEEKTIYEKFSGPYGKWWLPGHWFTALAMRARKEGRIKDSVLLKSLVKEYLVFRNDCGKMFSYDWISVPLVYTQVVTLATYTYAIALLIGRQYLDPDSGLKKHEVDLYVPVFTFLQFFFYVGWLKVSEQIVNPYGEDEDDFELNWIIDRSAKVIYDLVDYQHAKHPKLKKDPFWDDQEPQLPHTKFTINNLTNPQLGSAANLEVDPLDAEFLPMETFLEEDHELLDYDSVKRGGVRYRPSLLMNLFNASGLRQSTRRTKEDNFRNASMSVGHINAAFTPDKPRRRDSATSVNSRSSFVGRKLVSPTHSRASSISHKPSSVSRHSSFSRHKSKIYEVHQLDDRSSLPNGLIGVEPEPNTGCASEEPESLPSTECYEATDDQPATSSSGADNAPKTEPVPFMPSIPEEPSRPLSLASLDATREKPCKSEHHQVADNVQELVQEASKVLEELNRVVSKQGHRKDCELKGYESCCSLSDTSDEDDDDNSSATAGENDHASGINVSAKQDAASAADDEFSIVIEPAQRAETGEQSATAGQVHL